MAINSGTAVKVPVSVRYLGMAQVGRQCQHRLVDISAVLVPKHHAPHCKGMPKVVDSWFLMGAAVRPPELVAQLAENRLHLAQPQVLSPAIDEKGHSSGIPDVSVP